MASADEYAEWIVKNADKKGTPDFETVARAYAEAKQEEEGGTAPNTVARQTGLFARSGVKALAALPSLGADAVGGVYNAVADALPGDGKGFRFQSTMPALDDLMTRIGLPSPQNKTERIVSKGTEMGLGAGGAAAALSKASRVVVDPAAKSVLAQLGTSPGTQAGGGLGAGLAGEHAKESGGDWLSQLVSSVVGGLAGAGLATGAKSAATSVADRLTPSMRPQAIEARINIALQDRGIDPASLAPAMRKGLEDEARKALKIGPVSDDALARLADYRRVGAQPTRGRLSLDPFDITQEMNASKVAAATGARDAKLPTITHDNNSRLIRLIDEYGPLEDRLLTGSRAAASITGRDATLQATEKGLYDSARRMAGGDIPLERGPILAAVNDKLRASGREAFLPSEIQKILNRYSKDGNVQMTVENIDNLKTILATAQRSTHDGNVKAALSAVRDALEGASMSPMKRSFGGSQPVTTGGAQHLRQADGAAGDLMEKLNEARKAAFERRSWQRSSPVIENLLDDGDPANFISGMLSRSTSAKDVAKAAETINANPGAREAVRSGIAQYLKDAAIGKGNQSATGKFSGRQFSAALDNIGAAKLNLFFEPQEIQMLRAMGRVGTVEVFQPSGSAVNNSNTAAGMAGLVQMLSKRLSPLANKVPFGEMAISNPLKNSEAWLLQRPAGNIPRGLLDPRFSPDETSLLGLSFGPTAAGTALLTQ